MRNNAQAADIASPIIAMHQRYEANYAEYHQIEAAESNAHKLGDEAEESSFRAASRMSASESDALRFAILFQVPLTWADAMVLQYHAILALDLVAGSDDTQQRDWDAIQTAIDTVFDFMCCEVPQDHEKIGVDFQRGANRAYFARRYRTGVVGA